MNRQSVKDMTREILGGKDRSYDLNAEINLSDAHNVIIRRPSDDLRNTDWGPIDFSWRRHWRVLFQKPRERFIYKEWYWQNTVQMKPLTLYWVTRHYLRRGLVRAMGWVIKPVCRLHEHIGAKHDNETAMAMYDLHDTEKVRWYRMRR